MHAHKIHSVILWFSIPLTFSLSLDRIINPFLANHLFAVKGTQWHLILFANFRNKLTLISCCAVLNVSHPASIFWVQPQTLLQKQIFIHVAFFVLTSLASDSSIARVWVCHLFGTRTLSLIDSLSVYTYNHVLLLL